MESLKQEIKSSLIVFSPRRQKRTQESSPFRTYSQGSAFGFPNAGTGSTGATGPLINNGDFTKCEALFHI